ncbi:MAG: hypothetical protein PVF15_05005 [Candidatus Bathyarchaeota archaeon]|jgi:hypothetical protein
MGRKIEQMISELKSHVQEALKGELSLRDLYDLARIIKVLAELEAEIGGSEKEMREFIERLMRRISIEVRESA